MNSILENPVLKFHFNTMEAVREEVNLHRPGDIDRAIDNLQEWLKKQHHFTKKDYSREFLERCLIIQKGSLERTKQQMERICSLRTLLPEFFEKYDAGKDFEDLNECLFATTLPTLTDDQFRVFVMKFRPTSKPTSDSFMQMYRYGVLTAEYIRRHDYHSGIVGILDYRDVNAMDYVAATNIVRFHQMIKIFMDGFGLRIKGLHMITKSKSIDAFLNLVKKMLGRKVASRFHVHLTINTLFEYLPKNILPFEFDGYAGSLAHFHEQLKNELATENFIEYCKESSQAKSTQAYEQKDQIYALDLGLAGSFRTLNLD